MDTTMEMNILVGCYLHRNNLLLGDVYMYTCVYLAMLDFVQG